MQQANQVLVDVQKRVFDNNPSANIYGITPHFPCCLSNMHHGWPRFIENMWMATNDCGLIAVAYGPNYVTARVGKGRTVVIHEQTDYPFKGIIRFKIESMKPAKFPLHFRIPVWAKGARRWRARYRIWN